jgi:hypothetical protein
LCRQRDEWNLQIMFDNSNSNGPGGAFLQAGLALSGSISISFIFPIAYMITGGTLESRSSSVLLAFSLALAILISTLYAPSNSRLRIGALVIIILWLILPILVVNIIDTSYDGQWYHFAAISSLAKGWNPYWDKGTSPDFAIFTQHYPMGSWICPAVLMSIGVPLEATKISTAILLIASLFTIVGTGLSLGLGVATTTLIAIAMAFNPIALAQLFTRYNDGIIGSCLLIIICFGALWIIKRDPRALTGIIPTAVLALNLKFSVIPMLTVLAGSICLAWFLLEGIDKAARATAIFAATAAIAIIIVGYHPYVRNLTDKGHIFYPVRGNGAVNIMAYQIPDEIEEMSAAKRLAYSLFGQTSNGGKGGWKVPFTISKGEIETSGWHDTRLGGFGPLFSGSLVLAGAALVLMGVFRGTTSGQRAALFAFGAIVASVLVHPENWWARYVPQLWLAPAIVALASILTKRCLGIIAGFGILLTLTLNSALVVVGMTQHSVPLSQSVKAQIEKMQRKAVGYCAWYGLGIARKLIFEEAGLRVIDMQREKTTANCLEPSEPLAAAILNEDEPRVCVCESRVTIH